MVRWGRMMFTEGGRFGSMESADGPRGIWEANGSNIVIKLDSAAGIVWTGTVNPDRLTMDGTAKNAAGTTWNWTAARQSFRGSTVPTATPTARASSSPEPKPTLRAEGVAYGRQRLTDLGCPIVQTADAKALDAAILSALDGRGSGYGAPDVGFCRELGTRPYKYPDGTVAKNVTLYAVLSGLTSASCVDQLEAKRKAAGVEAATQHVFVAVYAAPENPKADPTAALPIAWCGY